MDIWLPALIGLGGIVLGVLLDRAFELWRDRTRLVLSLGFGTWPLAWSERATVRADEFLILTVTNKGRRPAYISSAGLMLPDKSTLPTLVDQLGQVVFPAILDERNPSVAASYNYDEIRTRIREIDSTPTHLICWLGTGGRKTRRLRRDWLAALTRPPPDRQTDITDEVSNHDATR
jgi:hypothetical protein